MFSHMAASCVGREVNRNNATGRRDNFVERVYLVVDMQRVGEEGLESRFDSIPDMVTDLVLANMPLDGFGQQGTLGIPYFDDFHDGTSGRDSLVQILTSTGILGTKNLWLSPLSGWSKEAYMEFELSFNGRTDDFTTNDFPIMTCLLELIGALDIFGLVIEPSWNHAAAADTFVRHTDSDNATDKEAVSLAMGIEYAEYLNRVCERSNNPVFHKLLENPIIAVPETGYCNSGDFAGGTDRWDTGEQVVSGPETLSGFWTNHFHAWTSENGDIYGPILQPGMLVVWDNTHGPYATHDPISELEEMIVIQGEQGGFTNRVSNFLVGLSVERYDYDRLADYHSKSLMLHDLHCTDDTSVTFSSRINSDVYGNTVNRPRSVESIAGWFRNEDRNNNFYANQGYYVGTWPERENKPVTVNANGVPIPSIQDVLKEIGRIVRIPGSDVFNPPMVKQ